MYANLYESSKVTYFILKIFGLISYKFNKDNITEGSKFNKIYVCIHFLVVLILTLATLVGRIKLMYINREISFTSAFLDFISTCFYAFFVLTSMALSLTIQPKLIKHFYAILLEVNEDIEFPTVLYKELKKYFERNACLVLAIIPILTVLDNWTWSHLERNGPFLIMIDFCLVLYIFIIFLQMDANIRLIKTTFSVLNQRFEETTKVLNLAPEETYKILQRVSFNYYKMCDLIELINKMFGFQLLMFVGCIILWIIFLIGFATAISFLINNDSRFFEKKEFTIGTACIQLIWVLLFLVKINNRLIKAHT